MYNIETALPVIDLEALENHLKAAKIAEDQWVSEGGSLFVTSFYRQNRMHRWIGRYSARGFVSCELFKCKFKILNKSTAIALGDIRRGAQVAKCSMITQNRLVTDSRLSRFTRKMISMCGGGGGR